MLQYKNIYNRRIKLNYKILGRYTLVSISASIIDFLIAYFLYEKVGFHYLFSSNIGIAAGFVYQYTVNTLYVMRPKNHFKSLFVYLSSLFLGVALSNVIMWLCFDYLHYSFPFAKILSMLIPFFFVYIMRKTMVEIH